MKIKFIGPQDYVEVLGHGQHLKDQVKDYPDKVAEELLAKDTQQRFEEVEVDPEDMTVRQLKKELEGFEEVKVPSNAKKPDLVKILKAEREKAQE